MASKSLPSNFTLPESGWTVPEIALKSVVLPAPFGPTIAMNWPSATSTETSTSAFNPPYATVIQHDEAIREPDHRLHRVLDDHDRRPATCEAVDHREQAFHFLAAKASERLVHQAQLHVRESARQRCSAISDAHTRERFACKRDGLLIIGLGDERAHDNVLQHRHTRKRAHDLKRSPDAAPADFIRAHANKVLVGPDHTSGMGRKESVQ